MTSDPELPPQIAALYRATRTPRMVDVPALPFLMIDGQGDPGDARFQDAVAALYGLSYTLRFAIRKAGGAAHKVAPLEGLWWADDLQAFTRADRSAWRWTLMIRQPPEVTAEMVGQAARTVLARRGLDAVHDVRLETFTEGRAAQVLHVGPYDAEGPTIAALHAYLAGEGERLGGKHHEIYLGDPRRAAPERLRTILRQPVAARQPAAV